MAGSPDRLLRSVVVLDRPRLATVLVVSLISTAAGLLLPGALATATDAVLGGHDVAAAVLWLLALGAAEVAADAVNVLLPAQLTSNASAWLRRKVTDRLLALGVGSPFAPGDAVSRVTGDCAMAGGVAAVLVRLISTGVLSLGAVVLLATLDWRLALVFLASLPLAMLLARSHLRGTAEDVLSYQRVSGELGAGLLDAVAGLRTIAASGTADAEADRVLRPLPRLHLAGLGMWRTQARMVWRAGLLLPTAEVAVLTAAGFGVLAGRLTVGDVLAALGYVSLGLGLVGQIPMLTMLSRTRSSARRITEVLDTEPPSRGNLALPEGTGALELRGATVHGALTEVDLTIPGGSFAALVGSSGSGKSTVVALLAGLRRPDAGQALLDGCDLAELRPEELRAATGYAPAEPVLLGATVAEAVSYGSPAGVPAVTAACRTTRIHDVLVRLPHGYHTPIAETPLSGGESARVGLARALVREPRVLLLDDATASLDTVTERAVTADLGDRTRVIVTHRAAMAARADLVVWLEAGRVRAVDPHEQLWQLPGYRAVFTEEA